MNKFSTAPMPYFGGKRNVVADVWARLGRPKQYIEPFCGSAAMLLGNRRPASLEVIGDANFYIANFWRRSSTNPKPAPSKWITRFRTSTWLHDTLG